MHAMQARLSVLKAEAAAAAKQTGDIKRRTEQVLTQRGKEEAAKKPLSGGRSALLAAAPGAGGGTAKEGGRASELEGVGDGGGGPATPEPPDGADATAIPTVKIGGSGWGVKGAASITDNRAAAGAAAGAGVGPVRYCSSPHSTHFEPSFLELNDIR
jgi:hypothetical protein